MRVPAATAWRSASRPECVYVPSPMLANRCGVSVNGARPAQVAPSPPIWVKVRVASPSSSAMKWQPMPALAKLPSGSFVDVACGQPAQNAGMRRNNDFGRSITGDKFRRQFHQRRQQLLAAWRGLTTDLRPFIGGQMIQRVTNLRFNEAALL